MSTSPVTYVSREVLESRITKSVDLPCCYIWGATGECANHARNWARLLTLKYCECEQAFVDAVVANFSTPICVMVNKDGEWVHGNGHHRFAIAHFVGLDTVPVVFAFDGDYMHEEFTEDPDVYVSYGHFGGCEDDDFVCANDVIDSEIWNQDMGQILAAV